MGNIMNGWMDGPMSDGNLRSFSGQRVSERVHQIGAHYERGYALEYIRAIGGEGERFGGRKKW